MLRTLLSRPCTEGARVFLIALAAVAASIAAASPASAQGFLDFLFGGGAAPKPSAQRPQVVTPGGRSYESRSVFAPPNWPRASSSSSGRSSGGGSFRTLCVRTCDGYYFPISGAATRDDFLIDQNRCTATCGSEARLFYVPVSRPDMDNAVDMSGRAYSALPNAFLYRKSLVNGCSCRAAPWSEAEVARHRRYAEVEAQLRPRTDMTALYGNEDQLPPMARAILAIDSTATVAQRGETAPGATDVAEAPAAQPSTIVVAEARILTPAATQSVTPQEAAPAPKPDQAGPDTAVVPDAPAPAVAAADAAAATARTRSRRTTWTTVAYELPAPPRRQKPAPVAQFVYEEVKPVRRQARSKQQGFVTLASTPATPPRRRTRTVSTSPPPAMPAMGLGAGGMVWPGDAPPSRRRG